MAKIGTGFGLGALVVVLSLGAVAPSSAEFFGCNDKPGKVLSHSAGGRYTHELAAQSSRPRIVIQPRQVGPGPNSKRVCRSWLAKEYRVSGTVVVPRQQCWWQ